MMDNKIISDQAYCSSNDFVVHYFVNNHVERQQSGNIKAGNQKSETGILGVHVWLFEFARLEFV